MIHARIIKRLTQPGAAEFTLDVEIQAAGGVTVIFGPGGAGKTLMLECIAGFVRPDAGRIILDDAILFDAGARVCLSPQHRNCGYIFPNDALFPHMTLRQNLRFAAARLPRLEAHRKVGEVLEQFRLTSVSERRPREVPTGDRRRCAMARALIGKPRLLLLDEPSWGLDAPLRADLYAVLREARASFRGPVLLATRDLEECCELGDQMLVLRDGRVAQTGPPRKVMEQPASVEIARLLDIDNVLPAEILALDPGRNTSVLRLEYGELKGRYFPGHLIGDRVHLCVRASQLRAVPGNAPAQQDNALPAKLARASERPGGMRLEFDGGLAAAATRDDYERGKDNRDWRVEFPPQALHVI